MDGLGHARTLRQIGELFGREAELLGAERVTEGPPVEGKGDLERARQTYQQSLDMFTEMGAPGYIKVLEERLGEMKI